MAGCRSEAKGFATSSKLISYVVVVVFALRFRGVTVASNIHVYFFLFLVVFFFFADRLRPV